MRWHGALRRRMFAISARAVPLIVRLLFLLVIAQATRSVAQDLLTNNAAGASPGGALLLRNADPAGTLHITAGRSVLMNSPASLRRIYVGNPAVLGTFTSGTNEVVLTAKEPGVSSLVLWDQSGGSRLYTVFADLDPGALEVSLAQAVAGASIHVSAGEDRVFLTGSVPTDAASDAAAKMAALYAKSVVNSLRVAPQHGPQVELKLRVVEVDRTRAQQLGINIFAQGRSPFSTTTGQFAGTASGSGSSLSVSNPLDLFLYNEKLNLGVTIQDLEQHQVLQVLAEPTLTTLSGVPARFLSGGEFPFPVAQAASGSAPAITIQFRPYGVKVEFTPTVNADGSIHIKLAPEVSTLDFSNAVSLSGFTIPAISTRRAETEIEIQDGQSFVVSGLLDHRTTESLSKIPGIGDVPILGQLFRSKNVNRSVVELMIMVTASVVDPLHGAKSTAAMPGQAVPNLDPSSFDASLHDGHRERKPQAGPVPPSPTAVSGPEAQ